MYQHKTAPGRKHYVTYTDLRTGRTEDSPTFRTHADACQWIASHVKTLNATNA